MLFRKAFWILAIVAAAQAAAQTAAAQTKSLTFTEAEKAQHKASLATFTKAAENCLQSTLDYQDNFFASQGFSPFFGDAHKDFAAMNAQERAQFVSEQSGRSLRQILKGVASIRGELTGGEDGEFRNMSCVGLVMRCLKVGFVAANQANVWAKIRQFTLENDSDGTFLQTALRGLGWKVYYWNADILQNAQWDQQEERDKLSEAQRGYHLSRYRQVKNKGVYYYTVVDDKTTLTNFGLGTPEYLMKVPLFVATAHSGYHVFAGFEGQVVEGHAGRSALAFDIVEGGPFAPLVAEGKPSSQKYRSGLIAVPPGY